MKKVKIASVDNTKYWYATEVHICVVCFREKKYRERVYDKEKAGITFIDYACDEHFI